MGIDPISMVAEAAKTIGPALLDTGKQLAVSTASNMAANELTKGVGNRSLKNVLNTGISTGLNSGINSMINGKNENNNTSQLSLNSQFNPSNLNNQLNPYNYYLNFVK